MCLCRTLSRCGNLPIIYCKPDSGPQENTRCPHLLCCDFNPDLNPSYAYIVSPVSQCWMCTLECCWQTKWTVSPGLLWFHWKKKKTEQTNSFDIVWSQAELLLPVTTDITQADWKLDLSEWPRVQPRLCAVSGVYRLTTLTDRVSSFVLLMELLLLELGTKGKREEEAILWVRGVVITCCDPLAR